MTTRRRRDKQVTWLFPALFSQLRNDLLVCLFSVLPLPYFNRMTCLIDETTHMPVSITLTDGLKALDLTR